MVINAPSKFFIDAGLSLLKTDGWESAFAPERAVREDGARVEKLFEIFRRKPEDKDLRGEFPTLSHFRRSRVRMDEPVRDAPFAAGELFDFWMSFAFLFLA